MSTLLCAVASLGLVAFFVTWAGRRNAPVAYEDEDGFHVVHCETCHRYKKCGPQRQCVLGYPARPEFFHRPRRAGGCPAPGPGP